MHKHDELTAAHDLHGRRITANRYRLADVTAGRIHLHVTTRRRCAAGRYIHAAQERATRAGAEHSAVIIHVTGSGEWLAVVTLEEYARICKLAGLLPT